MGIWCTFHSYSRANHSSCRNHTDQLQQLPQPYGPITAAAAAIKTNYNSCPNHTDQSQQLPSHTNQSQQLPSHADQSQKLPQPYGPITAAAPAIRTNYSSCPNHTDHLVVSQANQSQPSKSTMLAFQMKQSNKPCLSN